MSEESTGALGGAAQGAAAGASFGPVGLVVGAVVGAVFGAVAGGKARKARLNYNKGRKLERKISYYDAGVQRRDLVRSTRMARAQSVAAAAASGEGGLQSSAPQGAISSIGSQGAFNLTYFDQRIATMRQMQIYYDKAGKLGQQAGNISSLTSAAFDLYGAWKSASSVTPSQISPVPQTGVPIKAGPLDIPRPPQYDFGS
jgi:hypothetical protein